MRKKITSALLTLLLASTVGITNPAHAGLSISDKPLFVSVSVPPNVMFTLDDSGSMQWEYMPDGGGMDFSTFMFPRLVNNLYGGNDYGNQVPNFDDDNVHNFYGRSSANNGVFYNPDITYSPWSRPDGTEMPPADPTNALYNPDQPALGGRDLTTQRTENACWFRHGSNLGSAFGDPCTGNHTYWPITYFIYNGGSRTIRGNYTKVEITTATPPSQTFTSPGGETRTRDEEIQNFANWFQYHRSRILTSRGAIGRAFTQLPDQARVGIAAINAPGVLIAEVTDFNTAGRNVFYNSLYNRTINTSGTPLRQAASSVGQYFERTDDAGPWSTTPGSSGGEDLACRQSFQILMSDGFWNGGDPGVGDADGTAGATITGPDLGFGPQSFTYTPTPPFADASETDTLADVAMHYWKRDLRPGLSNEVPTTPEDPAFWQHLTSFGIGLGVEGSITPQDAFDAVDNGTTINWGDPFSSNANKIDDLLHYGINGRGGFFSASDPEEFANELSNVLADIVARAAPTTGVSVSATRLTTGSLIYAAEFDSDEWTGELQALDAETGTVDSEATVELASKTPSNREIFTYDPANDTGLVFKPGSASAIFPRLTASTPADPEWTAENIINYVRGDDEPNGVTTFRERDVMLGDIVNSRPVFSGARNEGWGTLDATYLDYIDGPKKDPDDCSAPCNREETVFIGANDGMLHAFDANTLEELFAYVPSTVHEKLHNLADPNYSHQFFVDGQVTVADAKIGGSWGTYLVGTLGAGGRGIFALDVTEPQNFDENDVLWELSADDDPDIGFTFGDPVISRLEDGTWVAVFGNGYNSDDEKAIVMVVDLKTGSVLDKLELDSGPDNGLSGLAGLRDFGSRKFLDRVYAGDLQGNMWRADFVSSSPSATLGGNGLLFTDTDSRPITATPDIAANPSGGLMVYFGTGKLIEAGDPNTTDVERFYAVRDQGAGLLSESDLAEITLSNGPSIPGQPPLRTTSSGSASEKGWFMKLKVGSDTGERVLDAPQVRFGNVKIDTFEPVDDPCTPGGKPRTYFVDALSGTGGLPFCNGCASLEGVSGAPLSAPVVIKPPGSGGSPSFGGYEDPASPTPPGSFPTPPAPPAAADTEAWCSELTIPLAGGGTDLTLGTICDGRNVWIQRK